VIFAAVGTVHGFERLVQMVDEWSATTEERVVAQIGSTRYEPKHCTWFRFASPSEMREHIDGSRAVITHAGVGMILEVLESRRTMLLVPRMADRGEHIDDHQQELAGFLAREGLGYVVESAADISGALERGSAFSMPPSRRGDLVRAVAQVLDGWSRR
jgi:UDP-N-acetylglucosamine transferase subunit ALG13